jgi:hypothetical protein
MSDSWNYEGTPCPECGKPLPNKVVCNIHGTFCSEDCIHAATDRGYAKMAGDEKARIAELEAERDRLKAWVTDLQGGMYVNCVYCGHRYGPGETTPVSMADALKEHVQQCPQHPMSALKAERNRLRDAIWNHRAQHGDDRCWLDDQVLYAALGDGDLGDNTVGDKQAMLKNCERYLEVRCKGGNWPTYAELEERVKKAESALAKINEIRDSIIGLQTVNWSDHVYPLVKALNEAGLRGMDYPNAREVYGSLLLRAAKAEGELADLRTELEAALDYCPVAIRVREGGGPENLAASVAVSLAKFYHADEATAPKRPE